MSSSGSGFRVFERRNNSTPGEPGFVVYRLEPATLDFAEISGDPERFLGFSPTDWLRPRFWCGRIHPEDLEAARAFFHGWAQAPRDQQLEYRVIDAAGRTVWISQIISIVRDASDEVAIRGVLMDITRRVAREAEVETTLFLKAELFRIIAEELAPPVRAISVFGDMLERHLAGQRDDVGSDYAVGLRDGLQRLDALLAQLMRMAQNGGGAFGEPSNGTTALRRSDVAG